MADGEYFTGTTTPGSAILPPNAAQENGGHLASIDTKLTAPLGVNLTRVAGSAVSLGAKTSANSIPVVLATDEATLPVSAASLPLPTGASTEATLLLIKAKTDNLDVLLSTRTKPADTQNVTGSVSISNFPATQPVSGTVTANAGTGNFTVVQPSGASLHVNVDNFPATQTVSGTVAATQSGTWNVGLSTGSNTVGKVDQGAGGASAWKVDGSAVTQPVSGTVTAVQATGSNLHANVDNVVATTRVGATLNTAQVSVANVATLILASNANRKKLLLVNNGSTSVYIGNSGVTTTTGQLLLGMAGYPLPIYFTGAVYGISSSGSQTISYHEESV